MYTLVEDELRVAEDWLKSLTVGDWPRGRRVASKQVKVLERIVRESQESERRAWSRISWDMYA